MNLKTMDKIFAGLLTLLGIYVVIASWRYGLMRGHVPGPGFFPFLSGLLLTTLSAGVLLRGAASVKSMSGRIEPGILAIIAGMAAILLAFVFLTPYAGFTVCAFVTMLGIGWICEEPDKRSRRFAVNLAVISLLSCAACHVFFRYLVLVNLPVGFLGF